MTSPTSGSPGRPSRRCSTAPRRCARRICAIRSGRRSTSPANPSSTRWRRPSTSDPVQFRLRYVKDARDIARHQGGGREVRLGDAALAAARPDRRQGQRPRHRLLAAQRHPRRRDRRGRHRPLHRQDLGASGSWSPMIAARSSIPTASPRPSRATSSRASAAPCGRRSSSTTRPSPRVDWVTYPILDITESAGEDRNRADQSSRRSRPRAPASRRSARSRPRSPTRSSTPPACACAGCRSRPTASSSRCPDRPARREDRGPVPRGRPFSFRGDRGYTAPVIPRRRDGGEPGIQSASPPAQPGFRVRAKARAPE